VANEAPSLADLLVQIRSDLDKAQKNLADKGLAPILNLDGVEATIQFVAEKTKEGGFRLAIPFFTSASAGAKLSHSGQATQSITVRLTPASTLGVAGDR
jgi:hypothetical protein